MIEENIQKQNLKKLVDEKYERIKEESDENYEDISN